MIRKITVFFAAFIVTMNLIPTAVVNAADPNQLFISPASSQYNIGASFTINVKRYDPNASASGTVSGTVTYPANLLKVLETSPSGSIYGSPSIGQGPGTITFNGTQAQSSGSIAQIFSIRFQAIGAGTATVSFAGGSNVNNTTTVYKSGVFTVINPNPATPQPQPQPSTTPKVAAPAIVTPTPVIETPSITEPEPQPTPDPTGLVTSVAMEPLYSSATITWKVNATNPTSTLSYGKSVSKLDSKSDVTKKPDGSFSASITGLLPGNRYYFVINGGGDGGKSGNYNGTIIARGFPVILVITENNQPAKSAQVKVGSRTYTATPEGKVSIGLSAGAYSGTIVTPTASLTINLTVAPKIIPADGKAPESQSFAYSLVSSPLEEGPGSGLTILSFIGVLIGGAAIVAIGFIGFMAYRRRKLEMGSGSNRVSSTVIIDDGYDWHGPERPETPDSPPRMSPQAPYVPPSNSSVHISDDEPLDMFDKAANTPLPTPSDRRDDGSPQTTNQPHSTKP